MTHLSHERLKNASAVMGVLVAATVEEQNVIEFPQAAKAKEA